MITSGDQPPQLLDPPIGCLLFQSGNISRSESVRTREASEAGLSNMVYGLGQF